MDPGAEIKDADIKCRIETFQMVTGRHKKSRPGTAELHVFLQRDNWCVHVEKLVDILASVCV